jgi:hypothetical protein
MKSIFKSMQDQSEVHSFFHWHSAVFGGLKSMENDVEPHYSVQQCSVFQGVLESMQNMKSSSGSEHAV